ncbi:P-loop containing nucleoside triphosphate hydrolase protein [Melampsora americana]|nr:P-loop containing nucleoside triphosphate hydrolase protein [Melampsora americana]
MPLTEEPSHALHVHSPTLKSLSLPSEFVQRLEKAGFTTASEIVLSQPTVLKSRIGLQENELKHLLDLLADACSPPIGTVLNQIRLGIGDTITLGSPALDKLFGPGRGIPTGQLTEIAGESSAGKTCLCLQLSLTVQLPRLLGGLRGSCIYISSECHFPAPRLSQMAMAMCEKEDVQASFQSGPSSNTASNVPDLLADRLMSNVYPNHISDTDDLIHAIHYQLPALIAGLTERPSMANPVRLIVLDSIGALLRPDGNNTKGDWTRRASQLNQIADGLKHLACRHNLAAVVINQVSDVFDLPVRSARFSANTTKPTRPLSADPPLGADEIENHLSPPTGRSGLMISSHLAPSTARKETSSSSPQSPPEMDQIASSVMLYDEQAQYFMGRAPCHRKEAALGLPWSNAINLRIMIHRLTTFRPNNAGIHISRSHTRARDVREARMIFSSFGGQGNAYDSIGVQYLIATSGILALEDSLSTDPISSG